MYEDKDIESVQVSAGRRLYFIDVKEAKDGSRLLKLTEGKKMENGAFDRHRILIYEEDIHNVFEAIKSLMHHFPDRGNSRNSKIWLTIFTANLYQDHRAKADSFLQLFPIQN